MKKYLKSINWKDNAYSNGVNALLVFMVGFIWCGLVDIWVEKQNED